MKKIKIGEVCIDSGCIVLTDPGLIKMDGHDTTLNESHTKELLRLMNKPGCGGTIGNGSEIEMVIAETGFGNGMYEVFSYIKHGRIAKLEIIFQKEE